jgi:predicted dehydrogenase
VIGKPFLATAALHMWMSPSGARADREAWGGGALFDSGIHFLDLLRWIVGEVRSVLAVPSRAAHSQMTGEDTAAVTLRFQSGALGQFNMTWAAHNRTMFEPLKILGDAGTIRVENDVLFLETRSERLSAEELAARESWIASELSRFQGYTGRDSVRLSVEHFLDCIHRRGSPLVDVEEATASLRIAEACNKSMASGTWVAVEE